MRKQRKLVSAAWAAVRKAFRAARARMLKAGSLIIPAALSWTVAAATMLLALCGPRAVRA